MLQRPSKEEYMAYYEQYVALVGDEPLIDTLAKQLTSTTELLSDIPEQQSNFRYAEGKWTLKEVIGHISDNERVMSYRLLRIARGDNTPLAGYDQDQFMSGSSFQDWSLSQIIEDYISVRKATLTLLRGLSDEAWQRIGSANGTEITARAIAYIIAGHELHHWRIIQDKYLG
ncbi:damage-inducible protein DinB [Paenibacillus sp. FSL H8-0548]|uniref:DinB family protein n=1 Tax=Paenibacillus sp. FSL H8-0548 TaxID=1920422 RepID=UPI00096E15C4|nr:DinB family protein [Paenibacillus sp. FSL H8-0548]OMF37282.1 damage-inducible protein DinB [Paenibacillus sp. FSL H8-0548]